MISTHFREPQDFYSIIYSDFIQKQNIHTYINIRDYWETNKSFWFSHNVIDNENDIGLIEKYQAYNNDVNTNFSLLLRYDQLTRHPTNITTAKIKYLTSKPIKELNLKFSTQIAFRILHYTTQYNSLKNHEKIFTLLCIRHNNNIKLKYFVLSKIYEELYKSIEEKSMKEWLRFLNASILDINEWKIKNNKFNEIEYDSEIIKTYLKNAMPVIDKSSYPNIINREKINYKSPIISDIYTKITDIVSRNTIQTKKIAVSISGGVDSMVVSYILNDVCKKQNIELILLHICYNNRECCYNEKQLLYYWASKLECKLYIRDIDEIKRERNTQYRQLYEDVTRKIRFSFYKYFNCPIILGHNRDDTFENMFSNLSKNIHFDNLKGMEERTTEGDVILLRPFINVYKKDIIHLSVLFNIPHLIDSTPTWSRRGKTRDTLMPQIDEFDDKILPGLEKFTEYTSFLYNQWKYSYNNWINKINKYSFVDINNIIINRDEFFNTNYTQVMFWTKLWFDLELPTRPSNKSINNIIKSIDRNNIPIKITVMKGFIMNINMDNIEIITV